MRPPLLLSALLVSLLATACAAEAEPESPRSDDAALAARTNCSFIPGCKELLEASDGPFYANLVTVDDGTGRERHRLAVLYRESPATSLLLCRLFPQQPPLSLVFVTGPEGARVSVSRSVPAMCPTSFGDNPGLTNSASFGLDEDDDPTLWNTLFPRQPDGSRWYALRVAAVNAHGTWDSRSGHDYRLVLRPR
jgi:hypothetical protein